MVVPHTDKISAAVALAKIVLHIMSLLCRVYVL